MGKKKPIYYLVHIGGGEAFDGHLDNRAPYIHYHMNKERQKIAIHSLKI